MKKFSIILLVILVSCRNEPYFKDNTPKTSSDSIDVIIWHRDSDSNWTKRDSLILYTYKDSNNEYSYKLIKRWK